MSKLHRVRHVWRSIECTICGSSIYRPESKPALAGSYPLDLEFTLTDQKHYYARFDSRGIPMREYSASGLQHVPTRVAAFGLAHFNRWLRTGDCVSRDQFLLMASWFMKSPDARWTYNFDLLGMRAPWISCMAQGEGISVLCRAFLLTGDYAYVNQACRAAQPLSTTIEDGGLRSMIDGKWMFLEEYPLSTPRHTLNGFLYALVGLIDLCKIRPEQRGLLELEQLLATLSNRWFLWDTGYWSSYDLHLSSGRRPNLSTMQYHNIHMALLEFVSQETGRDDIGAIAARWRCFAGSRWCRLRALAAKIAYRAQEPAYA